MNFLYVVLFFILITIEILMNAFFIASAVMNFKEKKYFHFGVDVTLAIISLAMFIKAVGS